MLAVAQPDKWVTVHVKEFIDEGAYRKNILLTSKYMYMNKIIAPVLFIFLKNTHVLCFHLFHKDT